MSTQLRSRLVGFVFVLPLLFAHSVRAESADKQYFQGLVDRWADEFNRQDGAALAKEYAEDAVLIGTEPTANGRDAVAAINVSHFQRTENIKITVTDLKQLSPDLIQTSGEWAADLKGDKPIPFGGKWLTVRQRAGNDWPIVTHMNITNFPKKPQP